MTKIQFTASLYSARGGFVCLDLPRTASNKLGVRGRFPVAGTINGYAVRSSAFPMGSGGHFMLVNKAMQKGANAGIGDKVKMVLELDTKLRTVTLAPDVKKALAKNKKAKAAFDKMSYSHQKEHLGYIEEAKRPETRAKRIRRTIETLSGLGDSVNG